MSLKFIAIYNGQEVYGVEKPLSILTPSVSTLRFEKVLKPVVLKPQRQVLKPPWQVLRHEVLKRELLKPHVLKHVVLNYTNLYLNVTKMHGTCQ